MPLFVAPISSCDVCLEVYFSESGTTPTPAVIACGHVFCRNCLETLEPPTCPLCRKAFNPERIKKLHVDRPEPDLQSELLRRAALAFYDTDEDRRKAISAELDAWHEGHADEDYNPVRMARAAFYDLNRLNERRSADRQIFKDLSRQLTQQNHDHKHERDIAKAVESSLRTQVTELNTQIKGLEAQLEPLRTELAKYQHRTNPLPPPPEPVPLDRFPAFARATAESAEGYAAYFTPSRAAAEPAELRPDPKGKGKQPVTPYANYQVIHQQPPNVNVIIPGASPSQRVFPVPAEVSAGPSYHSHAPATAYINGYASGFGQGYTTANLGGPEDDSHASASVYHTPLVSDEGILEEAIGSLRLYGVPAASAAIAPVASRPPEAAPSTSHSSRRQPGTVDFAPARLVDDSSTSNYGDSSSRSRPSASRRRTVQVDGHLGDLQQASSSSSRMPPIYADPAVAVPVQPSVQAQEESQQAVPTVAARRAGQERERQRRNRQSGTSWGTVRTAGTLDSHGSMGTEIGRLANFGPPVARQVSVDEVVLSDRGMVGTPRRDDGAGRYNTPAEARAGHGHGHRRNSSFAPPPETMGAHDVDRSNNNNNLNRRRFSPQASQPAIVAPLEPPPMENALGLDLGAEAIPAHRITAPTPRVQMAGFLRSWS